MECYDPKDFSKMLSVTMLRQGLPKFFNLSQDAVGDKRDQLGKGNQAIVEQYMTLA